MVKKIDLQIYHLLFISQHFDKKNVFYKPCETWIWGESPKKLKKDELH